MEKSVKRIKNFFEEYKFIEKIKKEFPEANWEDCLSQGQIDSKLWLIDELLKADRCLRNVFMYGGWYGTLAKFILETPDVRTKVIRSFDLDNSCHEIAETINRPYVMKNWKFKATTLDVNDINYPLTYNTLKRDGTIVSLIETPDTIINTSCEHMNLEWYKKVPNDIFMVLQSNNFFGLEEHINCSGNLEIFKNKYHMQEILFEGKLELQDYDRYMLIGYK